MDVQIRMSKSRCRCSNQDGDIQMTMSMLKSMYHNVLHNAHVKKAKLSPLDLLHMKDSISIGFGISSNSFHWVRHLSIDLASLKWFKHFSNENWNFSIGNENLSSDNQMFSIDDLLVKVWLFCHSTQDASRKFLTTKVHQIYFTLWT